MCSASEMIDTADSEVLSIPALPLRRREQVRSAVLSMFRRKNPGGCDALLELSPGEWKHLLHWLDISGLALYLLDQLTERNLLTVLPAEIRERLEQNLRDNAARTSALMRECLAIQRGFAAFDVRFALLKGFSLCPHSVPRLELRSQLDLDFLVHAADEVRAQYVLEERGYRLHGISGRSREFKTPYAGAMVLENLYKPCPQLTVEVHLEPKQSELLTRSTQLSLGDASIPVLQAAELFAGQALHLFKHLSRDQMRCSHMLELYRHVLTRSNDTAFWSQVQEACAAEPRKSLGLGLALDFVSQQMDTGCVPDAVRSWTTDRLPLPARLWVRRYGARVATAGFPGTKLYLLLQDALGGPRGPFDPAVRSQLIPRRLPPAIAIPPMDEDVPQQLRRGIRQVSFILLRLRYHTREGIRYLVERRRWRLLMRSALAGKGAARSRELEPLCAGSSRTATKP